MKMRLPFSHLSSHMQNKFSTKQAEDLDAIFKDFPDYGWDETQERSSELNYTSQFDLS